MRTFKPSLILFLFLVAFSSYSNVFAETTETENTDTAKAEHHAQNNLWQGVYQGFLPCDDCKGIKTSLALNKNNTYISITQYVGKSVKEIVEKGKFTSDNQNNTIVLTPRNSTQTRQYSVGENTLTQLDNDGNLITGKSADRYILRKTEITEPQSQTTHH
jgi:copper homeostasis protein (lipoprotein)